MKLHFLLLVTASLPATAANAQRMQVYSADTLVVGRQEATANLKLHVRGRAVTSGWTQPALEGMIYIPGGPTDHVLRFNLTAIKPAGIVNQAITWLPAVDTVITAPAWAREVRVCGTKKRCKQTFVPK